MVLKRRKYDFSSLRNVLANMRPDKPDVYFSKHVDSIELKHGDHVDCYDGRNVLTLMQADIENTPIVDIDGYVHVVRGKIICFTADVINVTEYGDIVFLSNMADYLTDCFGDDDMAVIEHGDEHHYKCVSFAKVHTLSDGIQKKVQVAIDDYKMQQAKRMIGDADK